MNREARVIRREGNPVRHRVVVTSDPCVATRISGLKFLQDLINDGISSGMMTCGPDGFDNLHVSHDGTAWTVVMEAEER